VRHAGVQEQTCLLAGEIVRGNPPVHGRAQISRELEDEGHDDTVKIMPAFVQHLILRFDHTASLLAATKFVKTIVRKKTLLSLDFAV
jgi:hypothetical protein